MPTIPIHKQRGVKPFQKGQSGNPSGTSKLRREVIAYAQSYAMEAVDRLVAIMRDTRNKKMAAFAAAALLDRGFGRPAQAIVGEGGEGPVKIEYTVKWQEQPSRTQIANGNDGPILEARIVE